MARTTLDIDTPILKELKALQKREKRSLGQVVSRLLAEALALRKRKHGPAELRWASKPMQALVDLDDKDRVYAILDDEAR
ncbi:MAG: antitoxin [Nitrospirales bacterium]